MKEGPLIGLLLVRFDLFLQTPRTQAQLYVINHFAWERPPLHARYSLTTLSRLTEYSLEDRLP
jgi:hypothetical protein